VAGVGVRVGECGVEDGVWVGGVVEVLLPERLEG